MNPPGGTSSRALFFFLLASLSAYGLPLDAGEPVSFSLRYESPGLSVSIASNRVRVRSTVYSYDNPVSATPASARVATNSRFLTAAELKALTDSVSANGFFKLADFYGAPARERCYRYIIGVNLNRKKKTVVYRSNPAWPGPPEAFSRVERLLLSLVR